MLVAMRIARKLLKVYMFIDDRLSEQLKPFHSYLETQFACLLLLFLSSMIAGIEFLPYQFYLNVFIDIFMFLCWRTESVSFHEAYTLLSGRIWNFGLITLLSLVIYFVNCVALCFPFPFILF